MAGRLERRFFWLTSWWRRYILMAEDTSRCRFQKRYTKRRSDHLVLLYSYIFSLVIAVTFFLFVTSLLLQRILTSVYRKAHLRCNIAVKLHLRHFKFTIFRERDVTKDKYLSFGIHHRYYHPSSISHPLHLDRLIYIHRCWFRHISNDAEPSKGCHQHDAINMTPSTVPQKQNQQQIQLNETLTLNTISTFDS